MQLSLQDKAQYLFEYISHVYAIDLPVNRDVAKYGAEKALLNWIRKWK